MAPADATRSKARMPIALRLRGGGGDGGVYPLTHAEMQWMNPNDRGDMARRGGSGLVVSGAGGRAGNLRGMTVDFISEETLRVDRCALCAVSQKALTPPIAVCELGYLYNKEELIERMLKKTLPPDQAHVTSMRCVADATLCPNPSYKPSEQAHRAGGDEDEVPFMCPVASVPMNGRHKFVFLRASGHVVSERAFKEMAGGKRCPVTDVPIESDESSDPGRAVHAIAINGADVHDSMEGREAREHLGHRAAAKKAAAKQAKKAAKAADAGATQPAEAPSAASTGGAAGAASSSSAPPPEGDGAAPRKKAAAPSVAAGKAAAAASAPAAGKAAQGKRGREWEEVVAAKSAASDVYKSLFITKEQREAELKRGNADYAARSVPARVTGGM